MGDLSKNISRYEVACKCGICTKETIDFETLNIIQDACDHFGKELGMKRVVLTINSAHRCKNHNTYVGGAPNSKHLDGSAADIRIRYVEPKQLFDYLDSKYPDHLGLGLYKNFVHVDSRREKARW